MKNTKKKLNKKNKMQGECGGVKISISNPGQTDIVVLDWVQGI